MKECEKWVKEKGYDSYLKGNDAWEYGLFKGIEEGWRAAFELMLKWLEIEEPFEDFYRRIEEELKDE